MTPPKKPLSVGDRVKIYGPLLGDVQTDGQIAEVIPNNQELGPRQGWITVRFRRDGMNYIKWAHPKQCRRLKPRPKRRRVWISGENVVYVQGTLCGMRVHVWGCKPDHCYNAVEFIEVRK